MISKEAISNVSSGMSIPLIRQMNAIKHPSSINLGIGQLLFQTDKKILDALANSTQADLRYGPNAGINELREAVAEKYEGQKEGVTITTGVQEAYFNTIMALKLCGAKKILVPNPGFGIYHKVAKAHGVEVEFYNLNEELSLNIDSLEKQIQQGCDGLVINYPGNPTGMVFDRSTKEELAAMLLRNGSPHVISDEIYSELSFFIPRTSFSQEYEHTIVLDGVSKSGACAGLRVGWAYTPDEELSNIIACCGINVKSTPATINQKAALPVVTGETAHSIKSYNNYLAHNAFVAKRCLLEMGANVVTPQGGLYIFPKFNVDDTEPFCRYAASTENGVVLVPGSAFGDKTRIRISLGTTNTKEGMKRFSKLWGEYHA